MISFLNYNDSLLGFHEYKEFLPKDFDTFNEENKHRQLFLNLINNILRGVCYFNKYEQNKFSNYSLKNAFTYKIESLLPNKHLKKPNLSNVFNLCINSTNIINNYQTNNKYKNTILPTSNLLAVARLISNCYINNTLQIRVDKDLLFHEFVLNKVRKMHSDKEILDLGDSISIKAENVCSLKIYTSWKNIEIKNPNIKIELENAVKSIKNEDFNQVYLAYPKDNNFTKQIPIYVDELKNINYQIKVVPYSLRSTIKNNY